MARSRSEGIPMGILGTPSVFPRAEARAGIALSAIGIPLLMNKLMTKNEEIARLERELRKARNEHYMTMYCEQVSQKYLLI